MKKIAIYFFLILLLINLISCSDGVNTSIKLQNQASNAVQVNFRGSSVDVPSGETVELTDIDKGEYQYETLYEIPNGATATAEGALSGTFLINAGTKILVVYVSTFDAVSNTYTIYASVTTSDDQTVDENPNPIGP